MVTNPPRMIYHLLQFQDFPDKIRYYLFKYTENKFLVLVYVLAAVVATVVVYRFLARKK